MKKYFLSIISALMLASSASAQFVITKTDDTKTNVDGKLTVETQGEAPTFGGINVNDISYITRKQNLQLTETLKANYFQGVKSQSSVGAANYYLVFTNDPDMEISDEQQFTPTTPGGAVVSLDIYAADSSDPDNAILPEGTYTLNESTAAGTADIQTTFVRQLGYKGVLEYKTVKSGTITVSRSDQGIYTIDGTFVSEQGEHIRASWPSRTRVQALRTPS